MRRAVTYGGREIEWRWWNGERVLGVNEKPAAYDVETVAIDPARPLQEGETLRDVPTHPLCVPKPVLGMAYDAAGSLYLIHTRDLARYFNVNRGVFHVGHNIQFDFWSLYKHSDRGTQSILWQMAEANRFRCSQVADLLIQLATGVYRAGGKRKKNGGGGDEKVLQTNLGVLAEEWGVGDLNKEDPYRLRFGELLGLSKEEMEAHPEWEGFYSYALCDVIATREVYWKQRERMIELMRRAGWSPEKGQKTYEIRPDALEKWGPLSEAIQVRASITLAELSRTPIRIDQQLRAKLETETRARYGQAMEQLLRLEPDIYTRTKPKYRMDKVEVDGGGGKKPKYKRVRALVQEGVVKCNKRTGIPCMNNAVLVARLGKEAAELGIDPPVSSGKLRGMSKSVKDWEGYEGQSPFLKAWVGAASELKLLSFFLATKADDGLVYANYELLKKSGRTSATGHRDPKRKGEVLIPSANVQQIPRENEDEPERDVRQLFLAPVGCKWLSVDYKAIEMATLAAACVARFGHSRLREVIRDNVLNGGPDLHQITAAAVLQESVSRFLARDSKEQARRRKDAKEVNFGFPGGMGVDRFVLATSRKKIHFTRKGAVEAKKAWLRAYPEMAEHLADHTELALAWQTGLPLSKVPKLSWLQRKRFGDYLKGKADLTDDEKETFFGIVASLGRAKKSEEIVEAAEEQKLIPAMKRLFEYRASTLTGRVRNNCTFSSAANAVFQGLAADGAKEAIFQLMKRGFSIQMFIHDEICVTVKESQVKQVTKQVEDIMVKCMAEVVGHDVPIAVESGVGDRWTKG